MSNVFNICIVKNIYLKYLFQVYYVIDTMDMNTLKLNINEEKKAIKSNQDQINTSKHIIEQSQIDIHNHTIVIRICEEDISTSNICIKYYENQIR